MRIETEHLIIRNYTLADKEKMDMEFIWWILHEGRTKEKKEKFENIMRQYSEKSIVIKNQKQLTRFIKESR